MKEEVKWGSSKTSQDDDYRRRNFSLTLNNEKSALISLLEGVDEFVAIDDIDASPSLILRQISSSCVGFGVLVAAGNTGRKIKTININDSWK